MAKPTPTPDPEIAILADRIGELATELAPYQPKIAALELARKQLREKYVNEKADAYYTAVGKNFHVLLGPKANETVVNIPLLFKLVGVVLFLKLVSVTLKKLREECSADVIGKVTKLEATGTRTLTIIPKASSST